MRMLQPAEAKRVRRADMKDTNESDGSDNGDKSVSAALMTRLGAQLATWLDHHVGEVKPLADHQFGVTSAAQSPVLREIFDAANGEDDGGAGEFEFRLFNTAGSAARVVLPAEDSEAPGEGGIISNRPASYYLVKEVVEHRRQQYEAAAVSGEDVVARSRERSWGLEMPWKIIHMTTTTMTRISEHKSEKIHGDELSGVSVANEKTGKKRPGKRRRIALRNKERARREVEDMAARRLLEKEEYIKDKKKRLNRVKKLRKRAKTKEKKLASGHGAGADVSGGSVLDG